jgi:hypothetical protein
MVQSRYPIQQVEGQWDELIKHPDQFAGRRVRVTVLGEDESETSSIPAEIRRWLSEGESMAITPRADVRPNPFGDDLVEKFRKQGLVL